MAGNRWGVECDLCGTQKGHKGRPRVYYAATGEDAIKAHRQLPSHQQALTAKFDADNASLDRKLAEFNHGKEHNA